jgi:hypothetical protein
LRTIADRTLVGLYREQLFSPGKVNEDAAILDATLEALLPMGYPGASALKVEDLRHLAPRPRWVLSMAQSELALAVLGRWEREGTRVINSVQSIRNCYRKPLVHLLSAVDAPIPPSRVMGLEEVKRDFSARPFGRYWLKRGDVHAVQAGDVVEVSSQEQLMEALDHFHAERIDQVLVQEHVEGEVIKFYGVGPGEYFDAFSVPSGRRIVSGLQRLSHLANHSAEAVGLEVFGGDAILTRTGELVLIDLNDWPSFSRCRAAAAEGIARHMMRVCGGSFNDLSRCG